MAIGTWPYRHGYIGTCLREVGGERCGGAHEAPARGERAEELCAPHLQCRVLRSPLEEATRQARRLDAAAAQRGARRLGVLVGGVLRRGRSLHLLAHRLEDDGGRVEAQHRGRAAHVAVHLAPGLERGGRQRGGRRGGRWVLHGLRRGRGGVAQRVGQRGGGREGGEQPRHLVRVRVGVRVGVRVRVRVRVQVRVSVGVGFRVRVRVCPATCSRLERR
eukprot:scaffold108060_cov48-Phaeocystis_antarctica.AAC.2